MRKVASVTYNLDAARKEFLLTDKWRESDVFPNDEQKAMAAKRKQGKLNVGLM